MGAQKHFECPVFHPTLKDVSGSFEKYIERLEKRYAGAGVCKIVAPKGWQPRQAGYDDASLANIEIPRPISQHATGTRGTFRVLLVERKSMDVISQFKPRATCPDNQPPEKADNNEKLERCYWQGLGIKPPLYGADVAGSLCDPDLKGWNLRCLHTLLDRTLAANGCELPGVTTPYLYFGMWRSTFAWHTEDKDLFSINYLHFGAPKTWYVVPPKFRTKFENALKDELQDLPRHCPEFLRHKDLMVSPKFLRDHGVEVIKIVQHPREFIVNFAGAYHAGYNHGWNCAESVNFATRAWIKIGAQARSCECNPDSVRIDMSWFLGAAHPRDRKLVRDSLPSASSSESDSGSDSYVHSAAAPGSERHSEVDEAESDAVDSTAELEISQTAGRKRARFHSPSSQDSASPPPPKRRQASLRMQQPAMPNTVQPPIIKRGPGRPRKDTAEQHVSAVSKVPSGSCRQGPLPAELLRPASIRQSLSLQPLPTVSAARQSDLARAARAAQRQHRQQLQETAQKREHKQTCSIQRPDRAFGLSKAAFKGQPSLPENDGRGSGSNESSAAAQSLPAMQAPCPDANQRELKPKNVHIPFRFASQALRSAAQLLSLRSRKINTPVCEGTRRKAVSRGSL